MSIDDLYSRFEKIDLGQLSTPEAKAKLSELETIVDGLKTNISNLTASDITKLHALAGRVSTHCPGTKLDTLFRELMVGIPSNPYPKLTELLHQTAPRPVVGNQLDTEQLKQWANAHPSHLRGAVTALADNVRCVSQQEFEQKLAEAVNQLNEILPRGEEYKIAVQEGKSNLWVAQLATQTNLLHTAPTGAMPLAFDRGTCPTNVVLFDDASISGEQMERIVKQFIHRSQSEGTPLENIYIVVPYMTTMAKNKIAQIQSSTNKPIVHLITSEHLPTIPEALAKDPQGKTHLKTLNTLYTSKKGALGKEMVTSTQELTKVTEGLTPTFFAHKVPDEMSFPKPLADGVVLQRAGVLLTDGYNPIIPEIAPYKSQQMAPASLQQPTPAPRQWAEASPRRRGGRSGEKSSLSEISE